MRVRVRIGIRINNTMLKVTGILPILPSARTKYGVSVRVRVGIRVRVRMRVRVGSRVRARVKG